MKHLLIDKVISKCTECIYCKYDGYYDRSQDSGFDCNYNHGHKRIADDKEVVSYDISIDEYKESKKSLFPILEEPKDPLIIPSRCPLKDNNPQ